MTTPKRAEQRRAQRASTKHKRAPLSATMGNDVLTQSAWCEDDDKLEAIKQYTHDQVIEALGDKRTSAVHWRIAHTTPSEFRAGDESYDLLERLIEDSTDPAVVEQVYRPIRGLLREHGGYLVIAMASGSRD